MNSLIYLLTLCLLAFITAGFTYFIHWAIGTPKDSGVADDRIFSKYGIWLHKRFLKFELNPKNKGKLNWYKAMGGCIYCMMVYISWIALFGVYKIGIIKMITNVHIVEAGLLIIVFPAIVNVFLRKIQ